MLNCYKCGHNLDDYRCKLFGHLSSFHVCPYSIDKYEEGEGEVMLKDSNVRYLTIELIHNLDRLDDKEKVECINEIVEALEQRKLKLVASE